LLDDLLNIGRGNTGGAREELALDEILQGAIEPLRNTAEGQRVEIHVSGAANLAVAADRSRLERAFGNLLVNALEVMPSGGCISIDCRADGENIVVRVADTGPGIPPEIRDRLFQPFASAGKKNGTGLGLALARQTVLDHGGKMWADGATGPGAAFFIVLPLARPGARFSANLEGQRVV
jgi:signal transduction histidine kinase